MYKRFVVFFFTVVAACMLVLSVSQADPSLILSLKDIKAPAFNAKSIQVHLTSGTSNARQMRISIAELVVQNHSWKNISVLCLSFQLTQQEISCTNGFLEVPGLLAAPISLQFNSSSSVLNLSLQPTKNENWQLTLQWDEKSWTSMLAIDGGHLKHFVDWLPHHAQWPKLNSGAIDGTIKINGNTVGLAEAVIDLTVDQLAFADEAGLHAGENIQFIIQSNIGYSPENQRWQWHGDMYWHQGAVFWQPIFFAGNGHHLHVKGSYDGESIDVRDSHLMLADMGIFNFSSSVNWSTMQLNRLALEVDNVDLSVFFKQVLQPLLTGTAFSEIEITGHADFELSIKDSALRSISLDLDDVSVVDQRERFAFQRINAHIPWRAESASVADIGILGGQVLRIPFGTVRVPLEINHFNLFLPQLALPVLNGILKLEDFSAAFTEDGWRWKFNGELSPVSMQTLTDVLQIQQMHGTLSGYIPKVQYDGDNVTVNGVLQINVFDGSVVIHSLKLIEPLGLTPHLTADIAMRNLDLDLLTRTFSFGKIEGRVDVDVNQLELSNWKPIYFDARLFSSPGRYSRRISQAAIENISALGGEGAVVAIQRSFLRFFEEFRYSKIGWRCALRLNICYMGGIESEPLSRYTLVKGGGIPAITVMGYNRDVSWQELLDRLNRITQDNEPIVQ